MKALYAAGAALCVGAAVAAGLLIAGGPAAPPAEGAAPADAAPRAPQPAEAPARLVVHEWGTFTSFSGSDGVPAHFRPDNTDLPGFVYYQKGDPFSKADRLARSGTVSMETPVVYFYADRLMRASVRVDFPRGWLTEWYPFAAASPAHKGADPWAEGQSTLWGGRLLPGETVRFPGGKDDNPYYRARATDAVALEAEVAAAREDEGDGRLRGGAVMQREKFLFYRGVGTFPPPARVAALGGGQARVTNESGSRLTAAFLVTARGGKVGFRKLSCLGVGASVESALPEADGDAAALAEAMVAELTANGLYEKEARAMVRTWEKSWFGEDGTRLLYLVPRPRTDELLPLTVEPAPAEVVRVLVGRHDFLTPEQEADVERQLARSRAAQAELGAAEKALQSVGRFAGEARGLAEKRLARRAARP